MKQSILKKPSHFFCDTESSIASLNAPSNFTIARSTDNESVQVKNVRFLGVDMVQQVPSESDNTESSLDYVNFQRLSGSNSNAPSPRPRKPKTSLAIKSLNMFGNGRPEEEELTVYPPSQKPSAQFGSASFLNLSFQMKSQQQQQPPQINQAQHELLKRTLRISSASLESRSARFADLAPSTSVRSSTQASNENSDRQPDPAHIFQSHSSASFINYPLRTRKSTQYSTTTPAATETKPPVTNPDPESVEAQAQQTPPRPKARINSASSTSTSHSSNIVTSAVYFPASNQQFARAGSAGGPHRTPNQLSGNGSRVAMTTNLALYTYLLQANRSLAKEMRASVIRSQSKIDPPEIKAEESAENANARSPSPTNISSSNKATHSGSNLFPGIQDKKTQPQLYRSTTSINTRVLPKNSRNTKSALVRNYSASYRRNFNLINSKFNN